MYFFNEVILENIIIVAQLAHGYSLSELSLSGWKNGTYLQLKVTQSMKKLIVILLPMGLRQGSSGGPCTGGTAMQVELWVAAVQGWQ